MVHKFPWKVSGKSEMQTIQPFSGDENQMKQRSFQEIFENTSVAPKVVLFPEIVDDAVSFTTENVNPNFWLKKKSGLGHSKIVFRCFVFLVSSLLLKQPLESSNNIVLPLILCEELVCTFNSKTAGLRNQTALYWTMKIDIFNLKGALRFVAYTLSFSLCH